MKDNQTTMRVYLFRGSQTPGQVEGRVFGFTPIATGDNLPGQFAPWSAFKAIELVRGVATPGVNITSPTPMSESPPH